MTKNQGNGFADILWDFIISLLDVFQEIRDRVANGKSFASTNTRRIMQEINANLRGPFFWGTLREGEGLLDFSRDRFERRGVEVLVGKGQYRLERKMVKWGSDNPEMPWLVLENTTVGAREKWWQNRAASGEVLLSLDAEL